MKQEIPAVARRLAETDPSAKPEIRWWLAGGSHTRETLTESMEDIRSMGFGGIEILTMAEQAMDRSVYGWDTPAWYESTKLLLKKATEEGMAFSFTSGPNWMPAVPGINPDDAACAQELNFTAFKAAGGSTVDTELVPCSLENMGGARRQYYLKTVAAMLEERSADADLHLSPQREAGLFPIPGGAFETVYLVPGSAVDLTGLVTDTGERQTLHWHAPEGGTWAVFSFWYHSTAQIARASHTPAWVINHLDRAGYEAQRAYWDEHFFTDEICDLIRMNGNVNFFQDSLEIMTSQFSGLYWCRDFMDEFRRRRGYDLTLYLPMIIRYSVGFVSLWVTHEAEKPRFLFTGCEELQKAVMRDVFQTQTDLYRENYLQPIRAWLNGHGILLRAQASYGFPTVHFEISEPAASVDILETETLEMADEVDYYRTQSGGVHLTGKNIFSAETGATNGGNYYLTMQHYLLKIHKLFAGGVNRVILHGYAAIAGPDGAMQWPGYEALRKDTSERWGLRQPYHADMPVFTDYLTRMQSILRRGQAKIDVGILNLAYTSVNMDFWYGTVPDPENHLGEVFAWSDRTLNDAGYTYEFFSPRYLEDPSVLFAGGEFDARRTGYRALIVNQDFLPLSSAKALLELAKEGMPVVVMDQAGSRAASIGEDREELLRIMDLLRLLPNVASAVTQAGAVEALSDLGVWPRAALEKSAPLMMMHRQAGESGILFALNPTKNPLNTVLRIEGSGQVYVYDAWKDELTAARDVASDGKYTRIPVSLEPEETLLLLTVPGTPQEIRETPPVSVQEIPVSGWSLEVESWEPGEKALRTEPESGKEEVTYGTEKRIIRVQLNELKPWKDIPAVGPEVSGIGHYSAAFFLPEDFSPADRVIIDFGRVMGSISAAVNGMQLADLNQVNPRADISMLAMPGENRLQVRTCSTLCNRMIALGRMEPDSPILKEVHTEVCSYGLRKVTLKLERGDGISCFPA